MNTTAKCIIKAFKFSNTLIRSVVQQVSLPDIYAGL